jgi:serine protease Do
MAKFRSLTIALVLVACCAGESLAQRQPGIDPDTLKSSTKVIKAFHDVVARPSESTVRVRSKGKDVAFGIVVDSAGLILTKASDLDGEIKVVFKNAKELEATLVGVQDAYDLALLKVDASDLTPIQWYPSKNAIVGQFVATVGTGGDAVAVGVVSVGTRKLVLGDQPPKNLGTNTGYLGVRLEAAEGGAKVSEVNKASPAEKAGLKVGDVVFEADGHKVIDQESLVNAVQRHKPKDEIELKIQRGDDRLTVKPVLDRIPKQFQGKTNPQETFGNALSNRRGGFPMILQHDTVLKPADCGGPLVDLDGRALGINIARAGRTETYAIPSENVLALLPDLKSGKLAPAPPPPPPAPPVAKKSDPNVLLQETGKLTDADLQDPQRKGRRMKSYAVKLAAEEQVTIELNSTEFDAYLRLEDSGGNKIAEDDDSGGDQNAKIVFRASRDGTYRIIVTTFDPNMTGAFTLTVRRTQDKSAKDKTSADSK